ncbi:MAG: hypothetical protein ACFFD8_06135 [Candidatus Thorarchaeota archaeon]
MPSKTEKGKRTERLSWTSWLKNKGLRLDRIDDKCHDREFRTARLNDQNFAISGGGRGGGRVYPISSKPKRKARCDRGWV